MSLQARCVAGVFVLLSSLVAVAAAPETPTSQPASAPARDPRLNWWRAARFGLFIHWGLYAVPAGKWGDTTNHAEWILETAQIPHDEYEKFVGQFNPTKFDADAWVQAAKDAGMRYIIITSKHHDGFCLFDSKLTDFDIMSTPFRRDVMRELSDACRRSGLKIGWYHSIMDWHHPDYLPRRGWETRSAEGADFDRYVQYLHGEVEELLRNYGDIGVMWFDGQWETTWNHERGQPLYDLCRRLQPSVIVNDRVDKGNKVESRGRDHFAGDYGTPEQAVPPGRIREVDWETCMTMGDYWGYNAYDRNWKSSATLIRTLAEVASKGGNFLLNVGPRADGTFPDEALERLRAIGTWMKVNGESIYDTQAGLYDALPWGCTTQKPMPDGTTRVYVHVFQWPGDATLVLPGVFNEWKGAWMLADAARKALDVNRRGDDIVLRVPEAAPDAADSVIVIDLIGRADVAEPPAISAPNRIFVRGLDVAITTDRENVELRYTLDGSDPTPASAVADKTVNLTQTATVRVRAFRGERSVSPISAATFTKAKPLPAEKPEFCQPGLLYEYYEGDWNSLPRFDTLPVARSGRIENFTFDPRTQDEHFAFRYHGHVMVPETGVYTFYTASDDGSQLLIGDELVVDNDGLHSLREQSGEIALAAGVHPITVTFFEKTGGEALEVDYSGPDIEKQPIPPTALTSTPPH